MCKFVVCIFYYNSNYFYQAHFYYKKNVITHVLSNEFSMNCLHISILHIITATTPTVGKRFTENYVLTRPEFPISDTSMGYGYGWKIATYRGMIVFLH
jgi:hypothetical protein